MNNATPQAFQELVNTFDQPGSDVFQKFYVFNSVGVDDSVCDGHCKGIFMCSVKNLAYSDYYRCLDQVPRPFPHIGLTIFAGILALIVFVIVGLMLYYCNKPRPPRGYYGFSNA